LVAGFLDLNFKRVKTATLLDGPALWQRLDALKFAT
jgi:hypothetical protein